jgi:hypothetical protein
VAKRRPKRQSGASDLEYQRFAEQFVDMILDDRKPHLWRHFAYGGFQIPPTWKELNSDEFVLDLLDVQREGGALWEYEIMEALLARDRGILVPFIKKDAQHKRWTGDQLARFLEVGKSDVLRKSLKELARPFSSRRGAESKLSVREYSIAFETAELLRPAILQLLKIPKTSRTLVDTLEYLQQDHPEACKFLLLHVHRLQQALNDPGLLRRAKKRIEARARVLADAMAGAEYQLSFSTSVEYVRQARR